MQALPAHEIEFLRSVVRRNSPSHIVQKHYWELTIE